MFSTILLCSDGSKSALKAAEVAAKLARRFEARLIVLSVFNPSTVPAPFIGFPDSDLETATDSGRYADAMHRSIERETGKVLEESVGRWETRREIGHPVDRITRIAKDEQASLIVVGHRGLSEWQSYLLGSVSDGVLHHAHCSVLVVR